MSGGDDAGVPQPRGFVAFDTDMAIAKGEEFGYPYVVKPVEGSWGRMVARINDRDAAEAVFEQRRFLGSAQQQVCYLQEYIVKPERDIRAFVIGDETPVAIGKALMTDFILPFEVASVLLLAALVGAAMIARRGGVAAEGGANDV